MKDNKGFAAPEAVLILVIISLISGIGWYVWKQNDKSDKNLSKGYTKLVTEAKSKQDQVDSNVVNIDETKLPKGWDNSRSTKSNDGGYSIANLNNKELGCDVFVSVGQIDQNDTYDKLKDLAFANELTPEKPGVTIKKLSDGELNINIKDKQKKLIAVQRVKTYSETFSLKPDYNLFTFIRKSNNATASISTNCSNQADLQKAQEALLAVDFLTIID